MFKKSFHRTLLFVCATGFLMQGARPVPTPNGWVRVLSQMTTGRSNACPVLLPDGNILITGGVGQDGALSSAELFSPAGRFYPAPQMMNARSGHACALLPDGMVLVAGGRTGAGAITSAAELYDPKAMTWKPGAFLLEARAGATVSVLKDNRILIAGGDTSAGVSDSMEIYDGRTGGFVRLEAKLSSPRREHAATVLADGRVLIAGGFDGSHALDTADLFDPVTGRTAPAGKLSIPRAGLTATTLLGGRVLVVGGSNGKSEIGVAEVFNPQTDEFQMETSLMVTPRRDHWAVRIPGNNSVMIAGGTFGGQALSQTEIYIPWKHRFQTVGDMESAKTRMVAGALSQPGRLLIAGGRNASGTQSNAETISVPTIKTDKADYHPGEPVTISGSGWLPNKPVQIVMVEKPDIDRPATITTMADEDGNISDSSFAPDLLDIGITFYLTATQEGPLDPNGQPTILTAQTSFTDAANFKFTDGTGNVCGNGASQYQSAGSPASFGQKVCGSATGLGNGSASVTVVWVQPNTSIAFISTLSLSNGNFKDIQAPNAAGQWTLNVYSDATQTTLLGTGTFFVGPFAGRLHFMTGPFSVSTNTCSPANTIQIQDASNVAYTALTFPTTVVLSSTSVTGAFYSDASCSIASSSVQIAAGTSNTPNFYYKDSAAGAPTLTGFATGIVNSATQVEAISVTAGSATHFAVSSPASATAGTAFSFTVTAQDASNLTATGYSGTVHFTSSDGQAVLPANATLTNGVGTFSATLKTAGSQTLTGTDTVTASITGTSGTITVSSATASHYTVSAPGSVTANSALAFTVTALDAFDNTATGYAGTVHFTSGDAQAVLPGNAPLTNGVGNFSATLKTNGGQTLTATDTVTASITGTSGTITVTAGSATHFAVSAPASATAGTAFSFTVTAQDASNLTATGYSGTVHFTSSDSQAVLPANITLTNGVGTFSATLKTAGSQTLSGTDTVTASITGTATITVSAAAASHYSVSAPASATANSAFSFTVTALDAFNNTVTGYAGTVNFTSGDPQAVLPANAPLTNGVGTFSATLKTTGGQTLTATDTATASITGTSGAITVTAGVATHFMVSAPVSATAGAAFSFTVTAQDASDLTATGYSGTVHFTSSDSQAVLPANITLTNGVGTFSATLKTAGSQTLTGTDTVTASITGTSGAITVSAAAASHYSVSAPASATANSAFSFTVTAVDAFNNTAIGYTGTVHFTSGDAQAVLPANAPLTNGVGNFSATLKTTGGQTLAATDTVTASITGTSGTITVTAGSATHFMVSAPASATAGTAFSFTVTAQDASDLTATGYSGTVHFTSSDSQAVLPANITLTNGVGTFSATLKTAGGQTLTGTDTVTASITGTSGTITVSSATASHYTVTAPASATANSAFSFTVTAVDAFNNTATGYAGTVHFTSGDAQAVLPGNAPLTNGVGNFSATLKTTGGQTLHCDGTVTASITGTSGVIDVMPAGSATHFAVSAPASATAGTVFSFTVTALDASNLPATGYSGTVHFTSSDGQAVLPGNATLTNGVGTFSATLKTAGSQTLTGTDMVTASITGTSGTTTVAAGPATHFTVSAPTTLTPNVAFSMTVTALDAFGNAVTNYSGTVQFASSDSQAGLPGSYTFVPGDGGLHTFSATLKTGGPQSITVSDGTSSGALVVTVGQTSTSVSLTASTTSPTPGQSVMLSAGITPASATGTVTFQDGGTVLGVSTLSSGVAVLSISTLTTGSHVITATFAGNAGYLAGTSPTLTVTVGQAPPQEPTVVSFASSENPATIGKPIILTVSINAPASTSYGGSVQFFENSKLIATVPVVNGQASLSVMLGVGAHSLSATYSGGGESAAYNQYVTKAAPAFSVVSSLPSTMAGQPVAFTAQVSSQGPAGLAAPTGEVQFFDGVVLIGKGTLVNGVATITVSNLTGGTHQINATYVGDDNWKPAAAKPVNQVVIKAQSVTVVKYLFASGEVKLAATVSTGTGTPTGSVQFVDASSQTVLSTVPLTGGEVTVSIKPDQVKAGMHLVAAYSGDLNFAGSVSTALTVVPVLNAASYSPANLAPDAIATIFGSELAGASPGSNRAQSEASLPDTTVRIIDSAGIGYATQLFFVSPTQINFLMPSGITLGPALATITDSNGGESLAVFTVARIAPGMFAANSTGMGVASALMVRVHADGSQDPRVNVVTYDSVTKTFVPTPLRLDPETDRIFLEVYVTGIRHSSNVTVTINGQSVPVLYAGQHGTFVGLDQINLELPASLKGAGEVPLKISADGQISNSVTVMIK